MLSTKKISGIMVLIMASAMALGAVCLTTEDSNKPSEPQKVELQGIVDVTYDANDVITSVSLSTDNATYNVVLDKKGLKLAKEMESKEVKVQGVVSEIDEQQWITVRSFEVVKEKEDEEGI